MNFDDGLVLGLALGGGSTRSEVFHHLVDKVKPYYEFTIAGDYRAVMGLVFTRQRQGLYANAAINTLYTSTIDDTVYTYPAWSIYMYPVCIVYRGSEPLYCISANGNSINADSYSITQIKDDADAGYSRCVTYPGCIYDLDSVEYGEVAASAEPYYYNGLFRGNYTCDITVPYTYSYTQYTYNPPDSGVGVGEVVTLETGTRSGRYRGTTWAVTATSNNYHQIFSDKTDDEIAAISEEINALKNAETGVNYVRAELIYPT